MRYLTLLITLSLVSGAVLAEPLRVFASVVPIQTFLQKVGGAHVDARVMVRPGFSPHTYDPTAQQISALAGAVLYVRSGMAFEDAWMARIGAANPRMQVLDSRQGLRLLAMTDHDHDHRPHGGGHAEPTGGSAGHARGSEFDPHVWTSPPLAIRMVGVIRDVLAALDPEHAADFARNHAAYVAELSALDRELRALLDPLPNRRFLVFHPAWGYFADTYRLTQVPIERAGKEPGARALAALIDQAKSEKIKVVFVQPQFDRRRARQVAEAIGGVVIAVDPLAADYTDNLRRVGREFARALQP